MYPHLRQTCLGGGGQENEYSNLSLSEGNYTAYVDSGKGVDLESHGTSNAPYKSITYALKQSHYDITILGSEYASDEENEININANISLRAESQTVEFNVPIKIVANSESNTYIQLADNIQFNKNISISSSSISDLPVTLDGNNTHLNGGLSIGDNADAYIHDVTFQGKGITSYNSKNIHILSCNFANPAENSLNAIQITNAQGDINIEFCTINSSISIPWLQGISINGVSGDVRIYYCQISDASYNAIQISNALSLILAFNDFKNWDCDNDHFTSMLAPAGRAIDIQDCTNLMVNTVFNNFDKSYGDNPVFIDSNTSVSSKNTYADGNILKISNTTISSLTCYYNYFINESDERILLFTENDSQFVTPDRSVPSVASFTSLEDSGVTEIYGMDIAELGITDLSFGEHIYFHGFLPYVTEFREYHTSDINQSGHYLTYALKLPNDLTIFDLSTVSGPIVYILVDDELRSYDYSQIIDSMVIPDKEYDPIYLVNTIRVTDKTNISIEVDWDGDGSKYLKSKYDLDLSEISLGLMNNGNSIASIVEYEDDVKPDNYSLDIGTTFDSNYQYRIFINASNIKQYQLNGSDGYWIGINVSVPTDINTKNLQYEIYRSPGDPLICKNPSYNSEHTYLTVYIDVDNLADFPHCAYIDFSYSDDHGSYLRTSYILDFSNVTRLIDSPDGIEVRQFQDNPPSGETPIDTSGAIHDISVITDWDSNYNITVNSKNIPYCRNSDGEWGYWIKLAFKVPDSATPEDIIVFIDDQKSNKHGFEDECVTIVVDVGSHDTFNLLILIPAGSAYHGSEYIIDVSNAKVENVSPHIVAFKSNINSNISYKIINAGEKVDEPKNLVKDNYVLVGWYKDADFQTPWDFEKDTVNSNTTLYAKWLRVLDSLELILLEIDNQPLDASSIVYLSPVDDDTTRIPLNVSSIPGSYISSEPLPYSKYYLSIGDRQYAEPLQVDEHSSIYYLTNLCKFDLILPAIPRLSAESDTEKLYFDYDSQSAIIDVTIALKDALKELGIYIDGWYTDNGYTTPYEYYNAQPEKDITTLYLKVIDAQEVESEIYNIEYVCRYNEHVSPSTLAPSSYISAAGATLPELNVPGYIFLGWYEDSEFSKNVENISSGETGDKIFYANLENILCDVSFTFIDANNMPLEGLDVVIIKDYGDDTPYSLIESTSTPGTYTASNVPSGVYFIYLNGAQYTSMTPLNITNEHFTETFNDICLMIVDVSSIDPSAFNKFYQGILEEGTLSVFFDRTALRYILHAEAQEIFEELVPSGYVYKGVYKDPGYLNSYESIDEEIPAQIRFYVKAFESNTDDSTIHEVTISLSDVSGPINDLEVSLRQYNEEYVLLHQINFTDLGNGTYRSTAVSAGKYSIYVGSEPYILSGLDEKIVEITENCTIELNDTRCLTLDMSKFIPDALSILYGQSGFTMPYKALANTEFDNYGYDLEGWYTDPGLTNEVTSDVLITEDTTLYANLTKMSSGVTISITGASGPITGLEIFLKPYNDESVQQVIFTDLGNGTYGSTNVPTGRYSIYVGSEPYILSGLDEKIVEITENCTIELNDTRCLTLDMSKFIPDAIVVSYVQSGVILPHTALENMKLDGYNLEGWYTDLELTNKVTSDVTINKDTTLYVNLTKISSGGDTPSVPTTPTVPDEKPVVKEDEVKNENGTTSSITETTTKKENADGSKETTVEKKEEVKDENGKVQSVIEETSKTTENKDGSKETVVEKKEEVKDENGSVQSVKEEKVSEKVSTDGTVNKTSETTVKDSKGNTLEEKTSVSLEDKTAGITTTAEIKKDADGSVTAETVSKIKVNSEEGKAFVSKEVVDAAVQHAEEVKKIAEEKGAAVTPTLEIEASSSGPEAETELPAESLAKLADAEVNVKVKTDVGDIELPPEVAKNLASKGEEAVSLSIGKADKEQLNDKQKKAVGDSPIFTLSSKAGEQDIHELGGTVKITVPYELKAGENPEKITVWYVDDLGNIVKKNSVYDPELKSLVFETDHFSFYFIAEDTSVADEEKSDNTLYYVLAAVTIIIVLAAAAYFLHKKK